ncbi:DNA-cytosine methyltransferase, partial [Candidatus Magnetobacterium bavaricum]
MLVARFFFDIVRILEAKRPKGFILENVKRIVRHKNGYTFNRILETLKELGYFVDYKVLNALDYGLPQKRERVFLVGFYKAMFFSWPQKFEKLTPLSDILETNVDEKFFASPYIQAKL